MGRGRGVVLIFGVVAHALDLMVPEAIRKKLEPMNDFTHVALSSAILVLWYMVAQYFEQILLDISTVTVTPFKSCLAHV